MAVNNRYQSYQTGYVPPTYAEQQTDVLQDSVQTQYQAEGTAQAVLSQMHAQRGQLNHAAGDVWEMRQTTEQARREITALQDKLKRKKRRLYMMIAGLGLTDFLLFVRMIQCGGSFFC